MTGISQTVVAAPDDAAVGPLRVGGWQIAPDLNRIARGDEVVVLEPKVMALLVVLASRAGRVFSRDELMAAVWPGVVVGDNALTQVVIKLRRALGDSVREPRYLEAIAKKGYRLVAPVQRCAEPPVPASSADRPAPVQPRARRARPLSWPWLVGIGAVAVTVAVALVSMPRQSAPGVTRDEQSGTAPPTIAVRPFEEIDTGQGSALIARAISADLVTDLSKVSDGTASPLMKASRKRRLRWCRRHTWPTRSSRRRRADLNRTARRGRCRGRAPAAPPSASRRPARG